MKISHRISFPGGKDFEQHECIFEMDSNELSQVKSVASLNVLQVFQLLNTLVVINGLLYQRGEGYIDKSEYESRKERIMSLMSENVKVALMEVLANESK